LRLKTRKKWNFFLGNFFFWRWKGAKRLEKKFFTLPLRLKNFFFSFSPQGKLKRSFFSFLEAKKAKLRGKRASQFFLESFLMERSKAVLNLTS
jgi:hypothetical protein